MGDVVPIAGRKDPLPERSDHELMALAAAGQRDAFAVLVGRHGQRVCEFCVKMMGDRRAGEDVAQEAWLALWAARGRYRPSQRLEAFLFTIARNHCRNALRGRRRRDRVVTSEPAPEVARGDDASLIDAILDQERQRRVHAAALALPAKLREAVLLRFVAGLDYPAISIAVGRNESTVRSRVFHGLRLLREHLEETP
jgi:RNA polymerase sigma-70 factor (ECF subfamily)